MDPDAQKAIRFLLIKAAIFILLQAGLSLLAVLLLL
ncbi:MAG: phosphoribosylformylglycinamidine synthase-associated small membrane protein [Pannonibacter phragmitetus]